MRTIKVMALMCLAMGAVAALMVQFIELPIDKPCTIYSPCQNSTCMTIGVKKKRSVEYLPILNSRSTDLDSLLNKDGERLGDLAMDIIKIRPHTGAILVAYEDRYAKVTIDPNPGSTRRLQIFVPKESVHLLNPPDTLQNEPRKTGSDEQHQE